MQSSTLQMIMNATLRRVEGLYMIFQLFEGLLMQSFNPSKDCMQSLNPLQEHECNPSTLPKIAFIILGRAPSKDYIFNLTSEQIKKSTTLSTLDKK